MRRTKTKGKTFTAAIMILFATAAVFPAAAQENGELSEAVRFLDGAADLSKLKVYKLAETDKTTAAPQIADRLVKTGELYEKLQRAAKKVLDYHRLGDHCNVAVFEYQVPTVFTYKLRSVSFSSTALEILGEDETAALVAHEIGHLYLARELADARIKEDARAARIAELKCDVIALITLKKLGIAPENLISAIEKLIKARKEAGYDDLSDQSASLKSRKALLEYFLAKKTI